MAELYVCVFCPDTCVHTHLFKQCETHVAEMTTRDEGKEENQTHANITGKFFHTDEDESGA